jgi:hypothetical protein
LLKRMPVSPIHPTGVVWRFTRLRLTHVQLSRSGGTVGIDYLFGRLPTTTSGIPDIAGPRPRYVLVGEGGGRGPFGRGKLIRPVNPAGPAQARTRCTGSSTPTSAAITSPWSSRRTNRGVWCERWGKGSRTGRSAASSDCGVHTRAGPVNLGLLWRVLLRFPSQSADRSTCHLLIDDVMI